MKPTRVRYGVMAFLCALLFLIYYDRVCISRAQEDIKQELALDDKQLALVFGAFSLASALFEMPSGALGDRYGPILGVLVAAVAILLVRHVQSATQAVVLMCITAAAFDFGQAANWATMVDIGGNHAGMSTGFINMVGNLGAAISPSLAEGVFNGRGWPTRFAVCAAMFVAAGAMWLFIDPSNVFYKMMENDLNSRRS